MQGFFFFENIFELRVDERFVDMLYPSLNIFCDEKIRTGKGLKQQVKCSSPITVPRTKPRHGSSHREVNVNCPPLARGH